MKSPEYIDCILRVSDYNRAMVEFIGGTYSGTPKLDPAVLKPLLDAAALDAQGYGHSLFNALFPPGDDLLTGYRLALALARSRYQPLRLRLQLDVNAPADLHSINWERLYDAKEEQTFGRTPQTVFSRLPMLGREEKTAADVKPKLLIVVSSPTDSAQRGLDEMDEAVIKKELQESFEPLAGILDYEFLKGPATRVNIRETLKNGFHALHIQAHGMLRDDKVIARLILQKDDGTADPVDEDFFAEIFVGLPDLRMVTLVACHSGAPTGDDPFGGLALALVRQNCPVVVAMQQPISFEAAKVFNKHFYLELARHGMVDVAVNEARLYVHLTSGRESDDWSAPVLFMRLKDARVWETRTAAVHMQEIEIATADDTFWAPIVEALRQGQLVPIIGPDINRGLLPSNAEITARWAKRFEYRRHNYPMNNRNDLPRVARFIEAKNRLSKKFPHRALLALYKDELLERVKKEDRGKYNHKNLPEVIADLAKSYFDSDPDAPHRILADLNISTYLTTVPDTFMFEALNYRSRKPKKEIVPWHESESEISYPEYKYLEGTPDSPLVLHVYGVPPILTSLVLTEDDHLDFLRSVSKEPWRLPWTVMKTLTQSMLLFLGFNMRDLDFRVLFKGVVSPLKGESGRIAVLQVQPEQSYQERLEDLNLVQSFLEEDSTDLQISIHWLSVRDFLIQLRDKSQAA